MSVTPEKGHLYGVGLGPGSPDLITLRGADIIRHADVIAYHAASHGRSTARQIAGELIDGREVAAIEELLIYPVTAGGGADYRERLAEFYAETSARLGAHLAAGRSVAVLSLGDPMLYSSYQHLHHLLAEDYPATVVPGVASPSAAAAEIQHPLAEAEEIFTILPATADSGRMRAAIAASDCVVIMKLGGHVKQVRSLLADAGMLDRAMVIERASLDRTRTYSLADADPEAVPYFAVAMVGSAVYNSADSVSAVTVAPHSGSNSEQGASESTSEGIGEVVVLGLGPGKAEWTTPEVSKELSLATDIVGYSTYVNRVPQRIGQRRHLSDNRVEAERSALALDLARNGARVAVVSSGDPGVFAMAAAVIETADDPAWRDIPIRVVPGMTAAQAVASRVGAPLGHDFAMVSLSDRLKPWEIVEKRLRAIGEADMAVAIYNPASKSRRWQIRELRAIMLGYREESTPVIVARAVGSEVEEVTITTLGEFDPEIVDMRTMVIIGASSTKLYKGAGQTRVYTARHYGAGGTSGTGALLK